MGAKVEVKKGVKMDNCFVAHKCIVHFNSPFNSQLSSIIVTPYSLIVT
jgi:hypothetical protein